MRTIPRSSTTSLSCVAALAEKLLHLAAHAHGGRICVESDVAPPDRLPGRDRTQQLPPVRESERQRALRERVRGRRQPPDHRVAALAVEQLALLEISFCKRNRICTPSRGAAGRLAAQPDRCHRNSHLESDEVP